MSTLDDVIFPGGYMDSNGNFTTGKDPIVNRYKHRVSIDGEIAVEDVQLEPGLWINYEGRMLECGDRWLSRVIDSVPDEEWDDWLERFNIGLAFMGGGREYNQENKDIFVTSVDIEGKEYQYKIVDVQNDYRGFRWHQATMKKEFGNNPYGVEQNIPIPSIQVMGWFYRTMQRQKKIKRFDKGKESTIITHVIKEDVVLATSVDPNIAKQNQKYRIMKNFSKTLLNRDEITKTGWIDEHQTVYWAQNSAITDGIVREYIDKFGVLDYNTIKENSLWEQ